MPNDVANILITPAIIYRAPVGTALPDETSVAYGADWGGAWINVGYTLEPLAMAIDEQTFELEVQQVVNPVIQRRTKQIVTFETTLAETTGVNLALALDGSNSDTAAGVGQKAFSEIKMGGSTTITQYAWGFEGVRPDADGNDQPVRVFLYKGTCVTGGQVQMAKGEATGIPIKITALPDTSKSIGQQLMVIHIVTDHAS